jgi:hypothetical protein
MVYREPIQDGDALSSKAMKPHGYHDLLEALRSVGCPICRLALTQTERSVLYLMNDRILDEGTYKSFRERRGLCSEHAWQAVRGMGGSTTLAIFYNVAMDEILRTIEATPVQGGKRGFLSGGAKSAGSALADKLEATGPCKVCDQVQEAEARFLLILSRHLGDPAIAEAYSASDGLCLPHFRIGLRAAESAEAAEGLIGVQREIWMRRKAELEEFIAKQDYRRSGEALGSEGTSWSRAAAWTAGEEGVFGVDARKR